MNIINNKKENKVLVYDLEKTLELVNINELDQKYEIWTDAVIITNDLNNLVYIYDKEVFENAKKMINITFTFEEVEEYYKKVYNNGKITK